MSALFHSSLEINASLAGLAAATSVSPPSPSDAAPGADLETPHAQVLPEVDRAALVQLLRSNAALRGSTSGQGA